MSMKKCSKCHNLKNLELFYRDKSSKDGRTTVCKVCRDITTKKYIKNRKNTDPIFKEKMKKASIISRRKKLYGMDNFQYEARLLEQNFCCKICKIHLSNLKRSLVVDHCHKTGKIRGLLCDRCNVTLGLMEDDIIKIKNMLEYLK